MNTSELRVGDLVRITHTNGWSSSYVNYPTTKITWQVQRIYQDELRLVPLNGQALPNSESSLVLYAPFENHRGPYLVNV